MSCGYRPAPGGSTGHIRRESSHRQPAGAGCRTGKGIQHDHTERSGPETAACAAFRCHGGKPAGAELAGRPAIPQDGAGRCPARAVCGRRPPRYLPLRRLATMASRRRTNIRTGLPAMVVLGPFSPVRQPAPPAGPCCRRADSCSAGAALFRLLVQRLGPNMGITATHQRPATSGTGQEAEPAGPSSQVQPVATSPGNLADPGPQRGHHPPPRTRMYVRPPPQVTADAGSICG